MGKQSNTPTPTNSLCYILIYFLIIIFLHVAGEETKTQSKCPNKFLCGQFSLPTFPFTNKSLPACGLLNFDCKAVPYPTLELGGKQYMLVEFKDSSNTVLLLDPILDDQILNRNCDSFNLNSSISFTNSPSVSFKVPQSQFLFLFKCNHSRRENMDTYFKGYKSYRDCKNIILYYKENNYTIPGGRVPKDCSLVQLPFDNSTKSNDLFDKLTTGIIFTLQVSKECSECRFGGGQCQSDGKNNFKCLKEKRNATIKKIKPDVKGIPKNTKSPSKVKLILITVLGSVAMMIFVSLGVILVLRRCNSSKGGGFSSFFSKEQNIERSSKYFGVHVFSYSELQKATNNFNPSKELGDGGFGTVYCGKLRDGREVAVKRLYEQNCKRMEQFINEIEILTRLKHPNLVTLYGCSSRNSRRLLLVYEYIPNGTLADHLHGQRAKHRSLTWPIRMNIAIQTANALAYLHASDIIHRDVKTANILLDCNFSVKVADFGLSRLFPIDVTHVSTTPQGTAGYVDPEYYECYKLTDRSDVYSFGVVLVELISSMPAVDMDRDSREINLANFAMNRILASEFHTLIDGSLGFETDAEVTRMTTLVAELAFRCCQPRKDMRPTMCDVLQTLLEIQGYHDGIIKDESGFAKCSVSPEVKEFLLEKNKFSTSPNFVTTEKWICSTSTTSNSV